MALQITESRGMFSIHGELNRGNATILKRHMSRFINPNRLVVLNLERVIKMDKHAAHMLRQLYLSAMRSNSILCIVGMDNDNIVPIMNETKTSYILSNDRV